MGFTLNRDVAKIRIMFRFRYKNITYILPTKWTFVTLPRGILFRSTKHHMMFISYIELVQSSNYYFKTLAIQSLLTPNNAY